MLHLEKRKVHLFIRSESGNFESRSLDSITFILHRPKSQITNQPQEGFIICTHMTSSHLGLTSGRGTVQKKTFKKRKKPSGEQQREDNTPVTHAMLMTEQFIHPIHVIQRDAHGGGLLYFIIERNNKQ